MSIFLNFTMAKVGHHTPATRPQTTAQHILARVQEMLGVAKTKLNCPTKTTSAFKPSHRTLLNIINIYMSL